MAKQRKALQWREIRKIHSWLPSSSRGWHQHPNGGGWVKNTAQVAESAFVGPEAVVTDFAKVLDAAKVRDQAIVRGEAILRNHSVAAGRARIEGHARLEDLAEAIDDASVGGTAVLRWNAFVVGTGEVLRDVCVGTPLVIGGLTHWAVKTVGYRLLQVGCVVVSIQKLREDWVKILRAWTHRPNMGFEYLSPKIVERTLDMLETWFEVEKVFQPSDHPSVLM